MISQIIRTKTGPMIKISIPLRIWPLKISATPVPITAKVINQKKTLINQGVNIRRNAKKSFIIALSSEIMGL